MKESTAQLWMKVGISCETLSWADNQKKCVHVLPEKVPADHNWKF